MNDPTLIGPCADYEHELVELHDGGLPPERAALFAGTRSRVIRAEVADGLAAMLNRGEDVDRGALWSLVTASAAEKPVSLAIPVTAGATGAVVSMTTLNAGLTFPAAFLAVKL